MVDEKRQDWHAQLSKQLSLAGTGDKWLIFPRRALLFKYLMLNVELIHSWKKYSYTLILGGNGETTTLSPRRPG